MPRRRVAPLLAVFAGLLAGAPAASAQLSAPVSAENVELISNAARHSDSAGAVLLDGFYYITTERDLQIYDTRANPEAPTLVGGVTLEQIGTPVFSEEDPTTNGRILVVSNTDTLIYDVSDKAAPKLIGTLPGVDQHTMQCVLDCTWVYGSEGAIIDLRDPTKPKLIEKSWRDDLGVEVTSTHDVTEVAPGILVTSTEPLLMLDARENPAAPKLKGTGKAPGFTHANLWPHGGSDDFLLVGGEATGPNCADDPSATFMTFDARHVGADATFSLIDQFKVPKGTISDGHMVDSSFCVHWFSPHPTYANGGLVAIAWYEQGTRFLKIDAAGKISEVGHFIAGASQASDVDWVTDRVAYIADYLRGLDIVKYTGDIPPSFPKPTLGAPLPAGVPRAPAAAPKKAPEFGRVARLPSAKRCVRARTFKASVRTYLPDPVVSAVLTVGGRRVAGGPGAKLLMTKRLGRAGRRVRVGVKVTTRSGATVSRSRTYRVCG